MKKQVIVFTNSYGIVIRDEGNPDPLYNTIHAYTNNGWRVMHVQGTTGALGNTSIRGSFCFVLDKYI